MNQLTMRISLLGFALAAGACAKTAEFEEQGTDSSSAGNSPSSSGGASNLGGTSSTAEGGSGSASGGGTSAAAGGGTAAGGGSAVGGGTATDNCTDGIKNGTERGVDCGPNCPTQQCEIGATCVSDIDCANDVPCVEGICSLCSDLLLSEGETDIDCGGSVCPRCDQGQACTTSADCSTRNCTDGVCGEPGTCLLANLEACLPCAPPNASDIPACEMVLDCYIENSCDPSTCSASNDDVCGQNTLQTHNDPMTAAAAVYACACP